MDLAMLIEMYLQKFSNTELIHLKEYACREINNMIARDREIMLQAK